MFNTDITYFEKNSQESSFFYLMKDKAYSNTKAQHITIEDTEEEHIPVCPSL